jgi:Cu2+-exporting ATPase
MHATVAGFAHSIWRDDASGTAHAVFAAEGIRCAGCRGTIERAVRALPGVERVDVNVATSRVSVDWRTDQIDLERILRKVNEAGFRTVPLGGATASAQFARERRLALKRIGLAGIGMMQVMMYVFGVYFAEPGEIDPAVATYFQYVGLVITTPVLLYSGAPFLLGAWRDLKRRSPGMDVPVAVALVLAYVASTINTLRGSGETYFDSVTMFIFFLSAGRFIEMSLRARRLSVSEAVGRSLPARVSLLRADGSTQSVPVSALIPGERISVPRGGVIPVDSELESDTASLDESLITGESTPVPRKRGENVPGGALNAGHAIVLRVRSSVSSSTLAQIVALLERAQASRPRVALIADRVASWFVVVTLIIASAVACGWFAIDSSKALPAALAVLVVTCPCALSLATPAAVAATTTYLARQGLLVTRADALERLSRIDTVVIDKTGTLTAGALSIARVHTLGNEPRERVLAIAAALERFSTHPIAAAFAAHADPQVVAASVIETEGQGIAGHVDGQTWRLGRFEFVAELFSGHVERVHGDGLYLGSASGLAAMFELGEELRPDAADAVRMLRELGVRIAIASGDREESVARVASALGIEMKAARLTPQEKIAFVRDLQSKGHCTLTIGDGINDGPVLAASDVSCAMGQGSAIAQAAADLLLLNDSLPAIARGVRAARAMQRVIRQNLGWSLGYNLAAVPAAALTLVPPWLAALGMSLSSLLVVLNARRLA